MLDEWFWAMIELTSTWHNLIFGPLQPNLERQVDLIYFLVNISCELGQIMTKYDRHELLYGIDEWFWAMFRLDWSKIELDRSSIFVDLSHELAIIFTYNWWIICPCRCLGVCFAGSKTRNFYTSFTSKFVQMEWESNATVLANKWDNLKKGPMLLIKAHSRCCAMLLICVYLIIDVDYFI